MVAAATERAAEENVTATFAVHDVTAPLPFDDSALGGAMAILLVQHLPRPEAFLAEVHRCLRPGGHLLLTAPIKDTSATAQSWYWRARAAFYQRVPGVLRFHDITSLTNLLNDGGFEVVEANVEPGRLSMLAHT